MRSMRSMPTGRRPAPAGCGYTGSISAHSSAHGTTWFISARNTSRRVVLRKVSNPGAVANVSWCMSRFLQ